MPQPSRARVVTVAGAAGLLGIELLRLLSENAFPVGELRPVRETDATPPETDLEKPDSVEWLDDDLPLRNSDAAAYEGADLAFLTGSPEDAGNAAKLSFTRVPVTIDLSGRFADNLDVPLVLAELGDSALEKLPPRALIAVPDAATAIVALALAPLHAAFGLKHVTLSTYEAASGRGRAGMDELGKQIRALFNYQPVEPSVFPRAIAFNAVPQVDALEADGHTRGERAMISGLTRLLRAVPGAPATTPQIFATRAWVPIFSGHSVSITLETEKSFTAEDARTVLMKAAAIEIHDDPEEGEYPVNGEAVGGDVVLLGRMRTPVQSAGTRLAFWVTADNLRRGSALAAVRVAEALLARST